MSRVKDMTSGKPAKLLLLFSFPLILGNLGQQLYMIVDAIIVGQGVGVEGLAAVGATDWTYWLALWVIQGTTQGFGILIAQYFGEGSREKMRKAIAMSIGLCAGTGVLLTGICLLIARPMLRLLQTPENIFNGAAAATVIAQFIAFLYCFTVLRRMELVNRRETNFVPFYRHLQF